MVFNETGNADGGRLISKKSLFFFLSESLQATNKAVKQEAWSESERVEYGWEVLVFSWASHTNLSSRLSALRASSRAILGGNLLKL